MSKGQGWFGWVGWAFSAEEVIPCRSLTGVLLLAGRIHRMERQGSGCVDRIVVLAGCRWKEALLFSNHRKASGKVKAMDWRFFQRLVQNMTNPWDSITEALMRKWKQMSFVSQLCSQSSISKQLYTVMGRASDGTDPGICFTCSEILDCSLYV